MASHIMKPFKLALIPLLAPSVAFAWFSNPEVKEIKAVSHDSFQICFNEPFKNEKLIYSLEFEVTDGKAFSHGGYFKQLLAKNKNDLCSSQIRLYDYFDRGNSTPKELRKILPQIGLSSFEAITIKVATSQGQTSLTKTQPDEVIFEQRLLTRPQQK
ncbi:hypothetical protein KW423_11655 [Vibrio fluvialis]|nr:hypothetical protein [Vibrio fluvialis]